MANTMRREYIILWTEWDLYRQSFADIMSVDNVQYIDKPLMELRGLWRKLFQFTHSTHHAWFLRALSKMLKLLFREEFWFRFYLRKNNFKEKNTVFIISRSWLLDDNKKYFDYLKNYYSKSRFVLFLCDLFAIYVDGERKRLIKLEDIRSSFDLILSFDFGDCEEYGFTYHPLVFSAYHGEIQDRPYSDLFFLGQPKNRFQELLSCFEKFWAYGLKTDIVLVGVPPEERVYEEKICYSDVVVPYEENLQRTIHCKCELEIMQEGGTGYTQRMCEVIALGKMIVTNNPLIHEAPFYNPDYIFQINNAEDITEEMCNKIKNTTSVDYHYKDKISPVELLQFIDERL